MKGYWEPAADFLKATILCRFCSVAAVKWKRLPIPGSVDKARSFGQALSLPRASAKPLNGPADSRGPSRHNAQPAPFHALKGLRPVATALFPKCAPVLRPEPCTDVSG